MFFFFFKQKTAYEMRISDWSSDVCSSDLLCGGGAGRGADGGQAGRGSDARSAQAGRDRARAPAGGLQGRDPDRQQGQDLYFERSEWPELLDPVLRLRRRWLHLVPVLQDRKRKRLTYSH